MVFLCLKIGVLEQLGLSCTSIVQNYLVGVAGAC